MLSNPEKIKSHIIELIKDSKNRLTPLAVEKQLLSKNIDLPKTIFQHFLKELISNGDLVYTYEFGSSFLEPSFEKPIRVSDHVVIKPERSTFSPTKDDIVITLQKGASFGSGRHPSTRLGLRAMESILFRSNSIKNNSNRIALDIGTGSGVLAIAAVLMGLQKAIGLDIDPCATSESMHNIFLNQLADRVVIDHRPFESIQEKFFLVLANLRFPTLADICGNISDILEKDGFAVFSGLKTEEVNLIENLCKNNKMASTNQFMEKDWASIVLHKTG
ncbi:MAG: 50S ribosomal protein L11 methyltransferase [Desulfobacterales bacterium]|nr:50S ribosomal protein L11 methyltransferase [Desulfobacterales bacterium]